jgi:hypothetical protein
MVETGHRTIHQVVRAVLRHLKQLERITHRF